MKKKKSKWKQKSSSKAWFAKMTLDIVRNTKYCMKLSNIDQYLTSLPNIVDHCPILYRILSNIVKNIAKYCSEWVVIFLGAFRYWYTASNMAQYWIVRTNIVKYWSVNTNIDIVLYHLGIARIVQHKLFLSSTV